jgi:hypothetical protein
MLCNVLAPTSIAPPLPFLSSRDQINQFTVHHFSSLLTSLHSPSLSTRCCAHPLSRFRFALPAKGRDVGAALSSFDPRATTQHNTPISRLATHLHREPRRPPLVSISSSTVRRESQSQNPSSPCDHPAHWTSLDRPSASTIGHWTVLIRKRKPASTSPLLPSEIYPAHLTARYMCPRCVPSTAPTRRWPHLQPWLLQ